jgi:hypothetical protein
MQRLRSLLIDIAPGTSSSSTTAAVASSTAADAATLPPRRRKRVLELGSACGALSIFLALLGVDMTASDIDDVVVTNNIRNNSEANHAELRTLPHSWGRNLNELQEDMRRHGPFDVIVASDILNYEKEFDNLVLTLATLMPRPSVASAADSTAAPSEPSFGSPSCVFRMVWKRRSKGKDQERNFFDLLKAAHFDVQTEGQKVFEIKRKFSPASRLVGIELNPGPLSLAAQVAAHNAARAAFAAGRGPVAITEAAQAAAEGLGIGPGSGRVAIGLFVLYIRCSGCGRASGDSDDGGDEDEDEFAPAAASAAASSSSSQSSNSCLNLIRQVATCYQAAEMLGGVRRVPVLGETEFFEGSVRSTGAHSLPQLLSLIELAESVAERNEDGSIKSRALDGVAVIVQNLTRFGRRKQAAGSVMRRGVSHPHPRWIGLDQFTARAEAVNLRLIFTDIDWDGEMFDTHRMTGPGEPTPWRILDGMIFRYNSESIGKAKAAMQRGKSNPRPLLSHDGQAVDLGGKVIPGRDKI